MIAFCIRLFGLPIPILYLFHLSTFQLTTWIFVQGFFIKSSRTYQVHGFDFKSTRFIRPLTQVFSEKLDKSRIEPNTMNDFQHKDYMKQPVCNHSLEFKPKKSSIWLKFQTAQRLGHRYPDGISLPASALSLTRVIIQGTKTFWHQYPNGILLTASAPSPRWVIIFKAQRLLASTSSRSIFASQCAITLQQSYFLPWFASSDHEVNMHTFAMICNQWS